MHGIGKLCAIDLVMEGSFVEGWSLDSAEFQSIVHTPGSAPMLHDESLFSDVYRINDGRIAARWKRYGEMTVFGNSDDYERTVEDFLNRPKSSQMLYKRNRYGKEFPVNCNEMVKEMADILGVTMAQVDGKFLKKLDAAILRRSDAVFFNRRYLMHYIAAIGEALIAKHQGEWRMELADDSVTWNPVLIVRGQRVPFFENLYEDIFINEEREELMDPLLTEIYETTDMIIQRNLQ